MNDQPERVTRLETHFEYVRNDLNDLKQDFRDLKQDMREMRRDVKELSEKMGGLLTTLQSLPTRDDLWSWKIQWLAVGLAEIVLIAGAIIGGLDWFKTH